VNNPDVKAYVIPSWQAWGFKKYIFKKNKFWAHKRGQ